MDAFREALEDVEQGVRPIQEVVNFLRTTKDEVESTRKNFIEDVFRKVGKATHPGLQRYW